MLAHLTDLDGELRERRDGYADAARAHLALLLVRLGRLHLGGPAELGVEPLVAAVFELVEDRYHEPISLRDVADVGRSHAGAPHHGDRRRTGRTVQQWITERRMREARRLLADTDLARRRDRRRVGLPRGGVLRPPVPRRARRHPAAWRRAGPA